MKIQFDRSQRAMIVYDDDNKFMKSWECHDDFVPGDNDNGEPHESLPNGEYNCYVNLPVDMPPCPHTMDNIPYGTAFIYTGDPRGRGIHGGGSGLSDPFAPRQADDEGWVPTYGCLRMNNEDVEELANMVIDNGNTMPLEVIDG